jgi:hypothetical protein
MPITPAVSPAKLTASPVVERPNTRVMGFSSRPSAWALQPRHGEFSELVTSEPNTSSGPASCGRRENYTHLHTLSCGQRLWQAHFGQPEFGELAVLPTATPAKRKNEGEQVNCCVLALALSGVTANAIIRIIRKGNERTERAGNTSRESLIVFKFESFGANMARFHQYIRPLAGRRMVPNWFAFWKPAHVRESGHQAGSS